VNDIAFRRHILVQALIILNFLLSLTPKAKAKLMDSTNKSVLYGYVLSDDDVGSDTVLDTWDTLANMS
jgi:THO complex subunit 1